MEKDLEIGEIAPDFSLESDSGVRISLHDYRGKRIILFFYPKDGSSGCTQEACSLRDNNHQFGNLGYEVVGISTDDSESHKKFKESNNLPFTLLSDSTGETCKKYDALETRNGLTFAKRVTYVIGEDGTVKSKFFNVDPTAHAGELIRALEE